MVWLSAKYMELQSTLDAAECGCAVPLQLTRLEPLIFGCPKWKAKTYLGGIVFIMGEDGKGEHYPFITEPSDWVSGLWRLQEAYPYSNVILADKEWNVLSVAPGEPIFLEKVLALVHLVALQELGAPWCWVTFL